MSFKAREMVRCVMPRELIKEAREAGEWICVQCGREIDYPDPQIRRQKTLCSGCYDMRDGLIKQRTRDGLCIRCRLPNPEKKYKCCPVCRKAAREKMAAKRALQ